MKGKILKEEIQEFCGICGGSFSVSEKEKTAHQGKGVHIDCLKNKFPWRESIGNALKEIEVIADDENIPRLKRVAKESYRKTKETESWIRLKNVLQEIIKNLLAAAQALPRFIVDKVLKCVERIITFYEIHYKQKFKLKIAVV